MKRIEAVEHKGDVHRGDVSAFVLVAQGTLALVRAMVEQIARNHAERIALENELYGQLAELFASMTKDKDA